MLTWMEIFINVIGGHSLNGYCVDHDLIARPDRSHRIGNLLTGADRCDDDRMRPADFVNVAGIQVVVMSVSDQDNVGRYSGRDPERIDVDCFFASDTNGRVSQPNHIVEIIQIAPGRFTSSPPGRTTKRNSD